MGIGFTLVKFVGIPAVIIVALGAALNFFRPQIFGAASSVGEVFTGIFTEPLRGAIGQINRSLGDLPDINIQIPTLNIGGGGISLPDIGDPLGDLSNFLFPPAEGSPMPPPLPPPETEVGPSFTLLSGSLPVSLSTGLERISRSDIIERFPGTLALFDIRSTPKVEFLPFGEAGILSAVEQGLDLRVSGQIFQERPGLNVLLGAA